jgi:hypothetical protein
MNTTDREILDAIDRNDGVVFWNHADSPQEREVLGVLVQRRDVERIADGGELESLPILDMYAKPIGVLFVPYSPEDAVEGGGGEAP